MSHLYSNSIFLVDTDKIKPNPYQPRREFDEARLQDLADSIRQYGILQPLTVSRVELEKDGGGLVTEYELIAGERRLRASKIAGVSQVPVIIRVGDTDMMKLELAILENLQREDLNAVDRARAFFKLVNEFKFTHLEVAKKMGKSREYVSNSLRILSLPEEILNGLSEGKITEGHTRPILMLMDHPEEQLVLFKEIVYKKITVREAEKLARKIAYDRVRKPEFMPDPEMVEIEEEFQEKLGTRVHIDRKEAGGQIKIDFFSTEDLRSILDLINKTAIVRNPTDMLEKHIAHTSSISETVVADKKEDISVDTRLENLENQEIIQNENLENKLENNSENTETPEFDKMDELKEKQEEIKNLDDRDKQEIKEDEDKLYDITNFSL